MQFEIWNFCCQTLITLWLNSGKIGISVNTETMCCELWAFCACCSWFYIYILWWMPWLRREFFLFLVTFFVWIYCVWFSIFPCVLTYFFLSHLSAPISLGTATSTPLIGAHSSSHRNVALWCLLPHCIPHVSRHDLSSVVYVFAASAGFCFI